MFSRNNILFLLLFCSFSPAAYGQEVCSIYYDYDAAGNRVKREYKCVDINTPDPHQINPVLINLYPNPTAGPLTISFNELMATAHLTVYTTEAALVGELQCTSCYELKLDLSEPPAGAYILYLLLFRPEEDAPYESSYTVIKF